MQDETQTFISSADTDMTRLSNETLAKLAKVCFVFKYNV